MNKILGPTFAADIVAAGLSAVPFRWDGEFNITFNDDVPQSQRDAVLAVVAAHDPTKQLVPDVVTRYQARAALNASGLLDDVNAHFASLPADDMGRLAWDEAPTVERNSPALIAAAHALGLTDGQIDQLFITAAAVK